jgi:hypothetical protein
VCCPADGRPAGGTGPAAGGFVAQPTVNLPSLGGLVGGGVAGVMQTAVKMVVGWFAATLVDSARSLVSDFLGASTHPRVTAAEFLGPHGAYHDVASMAVLLLIGCIMLAVIQGVMSGEPVQALARLGRDVPVAVLAIIGFPWLTDQMVTLSDVMADWVLPADTLSPTDIATIIVPFDKPTGNVGTLLLAQLVFLLIVLIYLELVVRNALTYVTVALAPLSFAAMTIPAAKTAGRKVVELTVAIVLIKPGVFIALRVGIDLAGKQPGAGPVDGTSWGRIVTGIAIVAGAAFMPWIIWRLLPIAEQAAVAQGLSRAPFRGAMQAMQTAYWSTSLGSSLLRSRGRAGGARAGTGPTGQPTAGLGRPGSLTPAPSTPAAGGQRGRRSAPGGAGPSTPPGGPAGRPAGGPSPQPRPGSAGTTTGGPAGTGAAAPGSPGSQPRATPGPAAGLGRRRPPPPPGGAAAQPPTGSRP